MSVVKVIACLTLARGALGFQLRVNPAEHEHARELRRSQLREHASNQEFLEKETRQLDEAQVEEITKDCDWSCYLERYPNLRNQRWEARKGNLDYARTHFIETGYATGRNCQCDSKNSASTPQMLAQSLAYFALAPSQNSEDTKELLTSDDDASLSDDDVQSCEAWADPHVSGFDNTDNSGPLSLALLADKGRVLAGLRSFDNAKRPVDLNAYDTGDFWLVKSKSIFIQARFRLSGEFKPDKAAIGAVAVGGPFLRKHALIIEPLDGQITFDGTVLTKKAWSFKEETKTGSEIKVKVQQDDSGGVYVLLPMNVKLLFRRLAQHVDVKITMPKIPGGIDGECGNYDGVAENDNENAIAQRMTSLRIDDNMLLLPKAADAADTFEEQKEGDEKEALTVEKQSEQDTEAAAAAVSEAKADVAALRKQKQEEAEAVRAQKAADVAAARSTKAEAAEAKVEAAAQKAEEGLQREEAAEAAAAQKAEEGVQREEAAAAVREAKQEEKQLQKQAVAALKKQQEEEIRQKEVERQQAREAKKEEREAARTAKEEEKVKTAVEKAALKAGEMHNGEDLAKEQSCEVWADPHVSGFDNTENQGPSGLALLAENGHSNASAVFGYTFDQRERRPMDVNAYETGDFWLVKHEEVRIQARQRLSGEFKPDRAAIGAVAVGGPFMNGHLFIVEPLDGDVTFDKGAFAIGKWVYENEWIAASQDEQGVVHADFPMGVSLTIRRLNKHVDLKITMKSLKGGVDGECGNFDGISENDDEEAIMERMGENLKIKDASQLLFQTSFQEYEKVESTEAALAAQNEAEVEEMIKGCNWDCYVQRYPFLKNDNWVREHGNLDYARQHYIKAGHGAGRNCQCDADKLNPVQLPKQSEDAASVLAQAETTEQAEIVAEAEAEAELIKGCDWHCYVERYPGLKNDQWENGKGNLNYAKTHYLRWGRDQGKNCKCQGPTVVIENRKPQGQTVTGNQKLLQKFQGEEIQMLGRSVFQAEDAHKQSLESEDAAQSEAEAEKFTFGCNWDCYLQRYPTLRNQNYEQKHGGNLDYARKHFLQHGRAAGKNCQCDADMLAVKLIEQSYDAATTEGELMATEQDKVVEQAEAEAELIKVCDWKCYLNRYPRLRNEKWEQQRGNYDYARNHYVRYGHQAGKNCECGDKAP